MGKYHSIANRCEKKSLTKGRPNPKPREIPCGTRAVQNVGVTHRKSKCIQGIVHNEVAKNHTGMLDTGSHYSMIGMGIWEIIKCHDIWIYTQVVYLVGYSKGGR